MLDNPRFPHKVQVYRMFLDEYGNPYVNPTTGEEEPKLIYESICGQRQMIRGKDVDAVVIKSGYLLSLPYLEDVEVPDLLLKDEVRFYHSKIKRTIIGGIEDFKASNFGMNIWFQSNSNSHGE